MYSLNRKFALVIIPAVAVIALSACGPTDPAMLASASSNPLSATATSDQSTEAPLVDQPAQESTNGALVDESAVNEPTMPAQESTMPTPPASDSEPLQPALATTPITADSVTKISHRVGEAFRLHIEGIGIGETSQ